MKAKVQKKVPIKILSDMLEFVSSKNKKFDKMKTLMGKAKGRKNFIEHYIFLTLYKYLHNIGFTGLHSLVDSEKSSCGFIPESEKTMRINIHRMLEYLRLWSKQYIYNRSSSDREEAAKLAKLPKSLKNCTLLIDSFDKKLIKSKESPSEDDYYSGKIQHRALRYTSIQDFNGFVNYLSNAYSPKVYDAQWVEVRSDMFEENYQGLEFIADTHYSTCKNMFGNEILFHCKYVDDQRRNEGKGLTKSDKEWNNDISKNRGRVEQIHSIIQNQFECLKNPWQEEFKIQEHIVHISVACHNYNLLYLK